MTGAASELDKVNKLSMDRVASMSHESHDSHESHESRDGKQKSSLQNTKKYSGNLNSNSEIGLTKGTLGENNNVG